LQSHAKTVLRAARDMTRALGGTWPQS